MTLPKSIPMLDIKGYSFLREIDFYEYKLRLEAHSNGAAPAAAPVVVPMTPPAGAEAEAPKPAIPRVVGFVEEMVQMQEILNSSMTNSVYVRGEEGVGKSALIIELLNEVALGEVAPNLLSKSYFTFDLHEFSKLSPADQVKQFDETMDFLSKKNSLLIIDRIDDFLASCGPDRSRRLMGSLINALENDRVSAVITAQTQNHDMLDTTSTLFSRYFKQVVVGERTSEETRDVLRLMVPRFEAKHNVVIGDDVVSELVRLDQRFPGRLRGQKPNSLVEFLDQLAASVNISKFGKPVELLEQEEQLDKLNAELAALRSSLRPSIKKIAAAQEKITALKAVIEPQLKAWNEKFGALRKDRSDMVENQKKLSPLQEKFDAYRLYKDKLNEQRARGENVTEADNPPKPLTADEVASRDTYMGVIKALKERIPQREKALFADTPHVTVADVQNRFSKVTGLPVVGNNAARLLSVEEALSQNLYGQDHAKRAVANVYRTRESGMSDPSRPAGVFFFTGDPGCGKSELVKLLAQFDGAPLIKYNMSQYTEASSVSRLSGANPGLVGFGETVTLPDAVRSRPRSIVFLDEIEKAHPDVQRLIMQMLEDGEMPDSHNEMVSFKDCIIFMASNALTDKDFAAGEKQNDAIVRQKLTGAANPITNQRYFLPEFITRIDAVVPFDAVTADIAKLILRKEVRDINLSTSPRGYMMELGDATVDQVIQAYFNPSQGGRSIRQLSKNVLRPLATQELLAHQVTDAPPEDDELRPMAMTIDDGVIRIDGHSLGASDVPLPGPQEPSRPSFTAAATATTSAANP